MWVLRLDLLFNLYSIYSSSSTFQSSLVHLFIHFPSFHPLLHAIFVHLPSFPHCLWRRSRGFQLGQVCCTCRPFSAPPQSKYDSSSSSSSSQVSSYLLLHFVLFQDIIFHTPPALSTFSLAPTTSDKIKLDRIINDTNRNDIFLTFPSFSI